MKHRISPATVIASVALFFSLGGVGIAATGYRITSIFQIAPKARAELHGAQGTQGPQGPAGPQGSPGSAGPQGPAGIRAHETIVGDVETLPASTSTQDVVLTATCPQGMFITGGGYQSDPTGAVISGDYPDFSDNVWIVRASNPSGLSVNINVRAVCVGI